MVPLATRAHVYRGDRSNDDDEEAPKERKVQNASTFAGQKSAHRRDSDAYGWSRGNYIGES